jgi:hypothetical protein
MKIHFFFLLLGILFITITSNAQITVTGSSISPVGTNWIYHADVGLAAVTIPPGGPNQVWNEPVHSFGYNFPSSFENPASTPYSSEFPAATHCVFTAGNYAYLQLANNEFRQLGVGGTTLLHYDPTSLIMPIPLTYPHSPWTRVFQYEFQVIPGFISTIRDSSIITLDGWGTLTTQYGTFQVLRTQERHWIKEYLNGSLTTNKQSVSYAWFDQRGITILSYTNPSDSVNFTTASIIEAELSPASAELINNLIPKNFQLEQNYPNPFNPTTRIRYSIPEASLATIKVYDMLGTEVATLVNEEQSAGNYEVDFSAKGGSTSGGNDYNLASGIYFYKLQAGSFSETRKMILMK